VAHVKLKRDHYTPAEVGALIGRSRQTVVMWIKAGRLKATLTEGGHWHIPVSEVENPDGHFVRVGR